MGQIAASEILGLQQLKMIPHIIPEENNEINMFIFHIIEKKFWEGNPLLISGKAIATTGYENPMFQRNNFKMIL